MFSTIEMLINKALLLDPKSKQRLKHLSGKNIKIEVRNLHHKLPIQINFDAEGLHLSAPKLAVFDVIVHGPVIAFLCLMVTKDPHKAAQAGLNFEGNIDVAQTAQALFIDLDIDWEEPLSKLTNDSFAHSAGKFFRTIKQYNLDIWADLSQSMTEYLQEERKLLPSSQETEHLYQDIEMLRDRVERSEARLLRLEKRFKPEKEESLEKRFKSGKEEPHKYTKPHTSKKPPLHKTKNKKDTKKDIKKDTNK